MSTGPKSIDRRTMLRGMGTAIALPLLDSMLEQRLLTASTSASQASAGNNNTAKAPARMVFMYVPNGMHMQDWRPAQDGANYEMPNTLKVLEPHRKKLSLLSGLTLDGAHAHGDGGGDHARSVAAFLTGAHPRKTDGADIQNDISVDQFAAGEVGGETRFASLELGIEAGAQSGQCDSGYSCAYSSNISWRTPTSPVAKEIDPAAVFDRLFAGQTVKETERAKTVRDQHRKSVLDFVLEDAKKLGQQLPESDKRKLDEYLYSVRDVEKRVVGVEKIALDEQGVPQYPRPAGVPREYSKHVHLMMDMMTLALQTDSTRIMTFMFTNAGNNWGYPEIGVSEGHHDLSHHGKSEEKQQKIAAINRFHVERLKYFLDRLDAVTEGEGSLLDNLMIVYGSGISDGDRHNHDDLPILLAGRGAGRVRAGRHIVYPDKTPLCNLYLWMLRQMGIRVDKFGDSNGVIDKLG